MNLFTPAARAPAARAPAARATGEPPRPHPDLIEIAEPADCSAGALPPEGNVKLRNYRLVEDNLRAYTPTGDVHTSPAKGKLVSRYEVCSTISPPRARILELLRPDDPGRDALEAIVKPAPRRGLARPLDDDTRRFLQRALLSPSPQCLSTTVSPEPCSPVSDYGRAEGASPEAPRAERSLADELREAEEVARLGGCFERDVFREFRAQSVETAERGRAERAALSVEEDEAGEEAGGAGLSGAARRLDALLAESRDLHHELAEIHEDIQAECARAGRCAAAARALREESRRLRFLDDVLALLRGDAAAVARARRWPFALGRREPDRSYII